jgi:hypothetical protein
MDDGVEMKFTMSDCVPKVSPFTVSRVTHAMIYYQSMYSSTHSKNIADPFTDLGLRTLEC